MHGVARVALGKRTLRLGDRAQGGETKESAGRYVRTVRMPIPSSPRDPRAPELRGERLHLMQKKRDCPGRVSRNLGCFNQLGKDTGKSTSQRLSKVSPSYSLEDLRVKCRVSAEKDMRTSTELASCP